MNSRWIPPGPFPEIETKRLLLREIEEADFPHFLTLFQDEAVNEHIRAPWGKPEEARKLFDNWKSIWQNGRGIRWSIVLKSTGEWVGNFGFKEPRLEEKCVERGLQISRAHWRMGYGSEASRAAMSWLKDHTPYSRIDSWIAQTNRASIGLIESQGFRATGETKLEDSLTLARFILEFPETREGAFSPEEPETQTSSGTKKSHCRD